MRTWSGGGCFCWWDLVVVVVVVVAATTVQAFSVPTPPFFNYVGRLADKRQQQQQQQQQRQNNDETPTRTTTTTTTTTRRWCHHHRKHHDLFGWKRSATNNDNHDEQDENPLQIDTDSQQSESLLERFNNSTTTATISWNNAQRDIRREFANHTSTVAQIQKRLVAKGLAFAQASGFVEATPTVSPPTHVPGCTASVVLQVALHRSTAGDDDTWKVSVSGTCDALVSRGLLATWVQACRGQTAKAVLDHAMPDAVADEWGLRAALSRGRTDGLASLVRTTQRLVRNLLLDAPTTLAPPLFATPQTNHATIVMPAATTSSLPAAADELETTPTTLSPAEEQFVADAVAQAVPAAAAGAHGRRPSVALLLSGGVDSSVALHLLLRAGYAVTAFYLKIWLQDEAAHLGTCPWDSDVQMCRRVCAHAGNVNQNNPNVPLHVVSLQEEYHQRVVAHALHEARLGRTPNPDVLCNARIKFGCFYEYLVENHHQHGNDDAFDWIATGHYAQLHRRRNANGTTVQLWRAPDPVKDQSYFLCTLSQPQLQRVLLPLGRLHKQQVRHLANLWRLPNRHRPDSQGLCFLGQVKFGAFLRHYLGTQPGPLVNACNPTEILGRHDGVWFLTIGQRKGLGPYLLPQATSRGPWYVVAKDVTRDLVYCSNDYDRFAQPRSAFTVHNVTWIGGTSLPLNVHHRLHFKIRHGPKLATGTLRLTKQDEDKAEVLGHVQLEDKDGGLAPGQYVVFYDVTTTECLGSGIISQHHWTQFLLQLAAATTTATTASRRRQQDNRTAAAVETLV